MYVHIYISKGKLKDYPWNNSNWQETQINKMNYLIAVCWERRGGAGMMSIASTYLS